MVKSSRAKAIFLFNFSIIIITIRVTLHIGLLFVVRLFLWLFTVFVSKMTSNFQFNNQWSETYIFLSLLVVSRKTQISNVLYLF